jgi:hypothetical protein
MARPPAKSKLLGSDRSVIQLVKTPLGFFALVVLVVEALGMAAMPLINSDQRPLIFILLLTILVLLILVVGALAYLQPNGPSSRSLSVILSAPPNLGFDLHEIEWLSEQCKICAGQKESQANLAYTAYSGALEVRIDGKFIEELSPTEALIIKLVDTKKFRWEAGPFYPQQMTQPLKSRARRDEVLKQYGTKP